MIEFQNVSKRYGGQTILDGVTFKIHAAERLGVIGANGAGKSTIFNLMVGESEPDSGTVQVARHAELGYMRQEPEATGADLGLIESVARPSGTLLRIQTELHTLQQNLGSRGNDPAALRRLGELQSRFEHLDGYGLQARAEAALSGLGFGEADFAKPLATFSGGWRLRAALARLLTTHPDVLLLDEPSNYLDLPAIEWLRRYLSDFAGTLVMISHDRYLLNSLTAATLEVAGGRVERYAGAYDRYVRDKATRNETRVAAVKNLDRKRQRIEAFVDRFRAKNTKAAQVQSKLKALRRLEEESAEAVAPTATTRSARIRLPSPERSGHEVVRLDEAGVTYDGRHWVFRGQNLRVERGQKIAVVGLNGMGKTTLLRVLVNVLPLSEGRRTLGHKVTVGYQAQDFAEALNPHLSVFENARAVSAALSDGDVRGLLGGFGFSGDKAFQAVGTLSGGEKIRAAFARLMMRPTNFLALDEPTTHLDIAARETLEQALQSYEGALCLVSHDTEFVRHVANRIWAATPQGFVEFSGTYDDYRAWQDGARNATARPPPAAAGRDAAAHPRRTARGPDWNRQARPLKKIIARAERESERLEQEQANLAARLADGRGQDFAALQRRLTEIPRELAALAAEWEKAGLQLEELALE